MHRLMAICVVAATLCACATPQTYEAPTQRVGVPLVQSVGGLLLRVNKSGDLRNVYGGADIFGGKVDLGYSEVRLLEFETPKRLKLAITDIEKQSTETTMDRYKDLMMDTAISVNTNVNVGAPSAEVPARIVTVDMEQNRFIVVGDYRITFIDSDGLNLTYSVAKVQ